jgi:hypothetical protein
MTRQQTEIMVRKNGHEFSARLRLQDQDSNGEMRIFETELPWAEVGKYCDVARIDKYKVGEQEPNDPTLYDQRTVETDTLRRFNFHDVT